MISTSNRPGRSAPARWRLGRPYLIGMVSKTPLCRPQTELRSLPSRRMDWKISSSTRWLARRSYSPAWVLCSRAMTLRKNGRKESTHGWTQGLQLTG
jgi:hypothetical protein